MRILKNQKLDESITTGGRLVKTDKLPDRVLCRVVYPICNIGKINANHRIYGRDVWERLFENKELMDSIKNRSLFGHAEHPDGIQSKTPLISHVIVKMWMDESKVYTEMDVLDTPQGRIIDALLAAKCNIGVSTRAEGDLREEIDESGNKCYHVIPEAYNFKVTDFTADPSTFGAFPIDIKRNIMSAVRKEIENEKIKPEEKRFAMKLLESIECNDKGECKIVEGNIRISSESRTNEEQITVGVNPNTQKIVATGDVKSVNVLPDQPDSTVEITVETPPQGAPDEIAIPDDGTQTETGDVDDDTSGEDIELSDEDFEEEFDLDSEDMKESKVNETEEIRKLYTSKGLKPPKGKGVHTKAFHKCATGYAAKIKSGEMTQKEAYKRCMGALGKKRAVKPAHQRNESVEQIIDYINEMLNERYKVGNIVQIKDKDGNTTIVPFGKVVDVSTTEPEGTTAVKIDGIDDWYDESQYEIIVLEESKINEDKDILFVDETGFLNDKYGVYRKPANGAAYLTFSFPTKEKAVEMAKVIAGILKTSFSETVPEGVMSVSKPEIVRPIGKDIMELQIKEATSRAERDLAVEFLNTIADKDLEFRILTKKLKEMRNAESDDVLALRLKLEEKAKSAQDLMKRSNELTAKINILEKKLNNAKAEIKKVTSYLKQKAAGLKKKHDREMTEANKKFDEKIKQTEKKVRARIIKEYLTKESNGLQISDNQRALLESCQTIEEVDKALDECRDVSRRRALHANPVQTVLIEKRKEPIDPVRKRQKTIINNVLGLKS